ncbi:MAG: DnaJ domain-containing protein [Candidatus Kaiserbacteria bacterium]|nr:DnaJ domain-containing protein [Candidatus Kaiserbacteria bacterium]
MKDYYKMLGVERGASQEDIQKAFRKLAHQYHPDKKRGDINKFKEVNEAYQVLSNQQKRAQYDAGVDPRSGGTGGFDTSGFRGFEGFDFGNMEFNFGGASGGFADAINQMFRGAMNRGADVQIDITISFEESVFGTAKNITIPYRRKASETVEIQVPAGIEPGSRLQYPGRGEPSKDGQSSPGDLFIQIRVQKHPTFERRGGDIVCPLSLTPSEALLGATKEIQDIRGNTLAVTVPEMSKEGTHIIFQGRGIPRPAGNDRLIIFCHIVYPKKLSKKAKEMLKELQKEGF